MNPLPNEVFKETKNWTFAVKPEGNCEFAVATIRRPFLEEICGIDLLLNPKPEPVVISNYSELYFIRPEYKKELDQLDDETILSCYALDLSRSKPSYKERLLNGIVLDRNGEPIKSVVSVGFSGEENRYLFVPTSKDGKFSIPVFENFSYWIRFEHKTVNIQKGKATPFLEFKLE